MSIDHNRAAVDVVEARQQVDDSGFARARRPNQCHNFARPRMQADILEHRDVRLIREAHVVEHNVAANGRQGLRVGRIYFGLLVDGREHALCARHGRLNQVIQVGDLTQRTAKLPRIGDKARNRTHRRQPLQRHPAARAGHNCQPGVVGEVHHRANESGKNLRANRGGAQRAVVRVELLDYHRLAVVGFHHALPGDCFFDQAVQRAQRLLLLPKAGARARRNLRIQQPGHAGDGEDADRRQHRVDPEHDCGDAYHAQYARNNLHNAIGQHLVDILDIIRQAAHQVAVRAPVEKAQRERLHAPKQVVAQVAHGALRRASHDIGLQPGQQRVDRVQQQHKQADAQQARHVARQHVGVDRVAEQVWAEHIQDGAAKHERRRNQQRAALALQVAPQARNRAAPVFGALGLGEHMARRAHAPKNWRRLVVCGGGRLALVAHWIIAPLCIWEA